jgi:hypothetical protein
MSEQPRDENPFPTLDPTNTIDLGSGRPLLPRAMPRCMGYMIGQSGKPIALRLWECRGWGTSVCDVIRTHDGHWAFGVRDESTPEKYRVESRSGFRLWEVTDASVIGLCNGLGHILLPPLIPSVQSPVFTENELQEQPTNVSTQSRHEAVSNKVPSLDDLTPTAWKLLKTIRRMGATTAVTATNRSNLTSRSRTGNHDSKHNQIAFNQLSDLGLIAGRRNVGTWITESGIAALDKRSISG